MAVTLVGSTDARVSYGDIAAIGGATALTVAVTFNASSFAGFEAICSQFGDDGGAWAFILRFENTDEIAYYIVNGAAAFRGRRTTSQNFVTGTTYRVVAKWRGSDQAQAIWVNGVSASLTDLANDSPGSVNTASSAVTVGTVGDDLADGIDADFSEFAIWGEYVPDWFCEAYGKGYSPAFYRSNGILYDPLINITHLGDRWGGLAATNSSGTNVAHPRVFYPTGLIAIPASAPVASAAITGTAGDGATEAEIVAGGETIIITLTNDTWVASGGTFDGIRQDIIDGLDSAQAEAAGWNAEVRDNLATTTVARTSDTVVTITLSAQAAYNITATETITVTVPGSAVAGGNPITATPTFNVSAVGGGNAARSMYYHLVGGVR